MDTDLCYVGVCLLTVDCLIITLYVIFFVMKDYGLVSIITPCYNAALVISKTIESVIAQTYSNWELLVVDDCSTDNTLQVVEEYISKDVRVKLLKTNKASGSPAEPRNIGIKNARGVFLAFVDSDDVWLPNKLTEQLLFMEKKRCNFVYSNYEKISWDGARNNRILRVRKVSTYRNTLTCCEIPCLTVLLKRELIENRRFMKIGKEDYVLWLSILREGNVAYNSGKVHALYRESRNSRSGNKVKMIKEQWYVLRKIEKINVLQAIFCLIYYLFRGLFKYMK